MRPSIAQAVRQLILSNELAGTRSGLRQLIAWLGEIADDFAIHGCDVDDLRWEIRRLERELRRRTGALIIALTFLTSGLLDGCSSPARHRAAPIRDHGEGWHRAGQCRHDELRRRVERRAK